MLTEIEKTNQRETLKQKQAEEMKDLQARQAATENLPMIPGATLNMIHGKLHGVRHFACYVTNLEDLLAYMDEHALLVFAWRGLYSGMYPEKPDTRDWVDAEATGEGRAVFSARASKDYPAEVEVNFFIKDNAGDTVRLSFKCGCKRYSTDTYQDTSIDRRLVPTAQYRADIRNHDRYDKPLAGYRKTGIGVAQHLFHNVDKQGATMSTLVDMDDVREFWKEVAK